MQLEPSHKTLLHHTYDFDDTQYVVEACMDCIWKHSICESELFQVVKALDDWRVQ
jgi:hypothetical protein